MSIEKSVKQNFSTEKVCSFCHSNAIRTFLKPVIDLQGTGAQIRRLRKLNGFSVHELQQIFGFEYPQAIYAWDRERRHSRKNSRGLFLVSLEAAMLRTLGKNAPTIDNLLVLAQLFKVDISEIVVSATIEVSLPCSEHRERPERQNCECRSNFSEFRLNFCETDKTCMNDQGAYCEQCRFKKSA